jgi:L-amino acid N-acyltransferase YncA
MIIPRISKAHAITDCDAVWEILQPIIANGDVFAYYPKSSKSEMLAYWFSLEKHVYIAKIEGEIVGTFFIQNNQPGLGSHVANASFAVKTDKNGLGIGKKMGEFSLKEAKVLGYQAMQFNLVIKSNEKAVKLWQSIGFRIIGEIPDAFNHDKLGMTNAYIMYKEL